MIESSKMSSSTLKCWGPGKPRKRLIPKSNTNFNPLTLVVSTKVLIRPCYPVHAQLRNHNVWFGLDVALPGEEDLPRKMENQVMMPAMTPMDKMLLSCAPTISQWSPWIKMRHEWEVIKGTRSAQTHIRKGIKSEIFHPSSSVATHESESA